MPHKATQQLDSLATSVPIQTLKVEVIEGPDRGTTVCAEGATLTVGTARGNSLVLTDPTVSRYHVEFEVRDNRIRCVDHGSTNGTIAHAVRLERAVVPAGTPLRIGETVIKIGPGETRPQSIHPSAEMHGLRGSSPAMRHLMRRLEKAARSGASTLIVGESGTGKELVARAYHELGDSSGGPFVTVDCGAMAPNLVASELFGHERGSFTGAERQRAGAFERADGGTLFLDEVGELPAELQPNLLGALERRRFRRVGGEREIEVNVRVVAATHRELRKEVNEGSFRLDLFYRLAVVTLKVPPLRDRVEDIPLLIQHFLTELGADPQSPLFDLGLLEQLEKHAWPGNVRELRNMVEAMVAMGEGPDYLEPMSPEDAGTVAASILSLGYKEARGSVLQNFERSYLSHWLEKTDGNVAAAARGAQMDRSHMFHLLRRHNLR